MMLTCPMMTTSRRVEDPISRLRVFAMLSCPVATNLSARRRFRERDEDFANETKMDNIHLSEHFLEAQIR